MNSYLLWFIKLLVFALSVRFQSISLQNATFVVYCDGDAINL